MPRFRHIQETPEIASEIRELPIGCGAPHPARSCEPRKKLRRGARQLSGPRQAAESCGPRTRLRSAAVRLATRSVKEINDLAEKGDVARRLRPDQRRHPEPVEVFVAKRSEQGITLIEIGVVVVFMAAFARRLRSRSPSRALFGRCPPFFFWAPPFPPLLAL